MRHLLEKIFFLHFWGNYWCEAIIDVRQFIMKTRYFFSITLTYHTTALSHMWYNVSTHYMYFSTQGKRVCVFCLNSKPMANWKTIQKKVAPLQCSAIMVPSYSSTIVVVHSSAARAHFKNLTSWKIPPTSTQQHNCANLMQYCIKVSRHLHCF